MTTHALMTTTLPTIIGMGVVSKTTETMFAPGKGKRAKAGRSPVSRKGTRRFGGKVYQAANWHTTKAVADKDAGYFRRAGHSARVVKTYNARVKRWGYMVYVR